MVFLIKKIFQSLTNDAADQYESMEQFIHSHVADIEKRRPIKRVSCWA